MIEIDTRTKSVSTDQNPAHPEGQTALQDESIVQRLKENPEDADAQLDAALDASMDGSDPISIAQPARAAEPAPTDGQHGEEPEVRSNA
jgi:hypothetical protein